MPGNAPSWQCCVLPIPLCLGATATPADASGCMKTPLGSYETGVVGLVQLPAAASLAPAPGAGGAAPGNISAGWECGRALRAFGLAARA